MPTKGKYTESKHKRDKSGKFTIGGGAGNKPKAKAMVNEQVLTLENEAVRIVGRTQDGRVLVRGADGNDRVFDPKALKKMPSDEDFANLAKDQQRRDKVNAEIERLANAGKEKAAKALLYAEEKKMADQRRFIDGVQNGEGKPKKKLSAKEAAAERVKKRKSKKGSKYEEQAFVRLARMEREKKAKRAAVGESVPRTYHSRIPLIKES
jgi:hypothetical protein